MEEYIRLEIGFILDRCHHQQIILLQMGKYGMGEWLNQKAGLLAMD